MNRQGVLKEDLWKTPNRTLGTFKRRSLSKYPLWIVGDSWKKIFKRPSMHYWRFLRDEKFWKLWWGSKHCQGESKSETLKIPRWTIEEFLRNIFEIPLIVPHEHLKDRIQKEARWAIKRLWKVNISKCSTNCQTNLKEGKISLHKSPDELSGPFKRKHNRKFKIVLISVMSKFFLWLGVNHNRENNT
jgi:hypothetical protein